MPRQTNTTVNCLKTKYSPALKFSQKKERILAEGMGRKKEKKKQREREGLGIKKG